MVDEEGGKLGMSEIDVSYYKRMLNARRSKASADNITEIASLKKEAAYRARAKNYRDRGDNNKADIYETKANSLESDKLKEAMKGRRGLELKSIIKATAKQLADARASGDMGLVQKKQQELFIANNLANEKMNQFINNLNKNDTIKLQLDFQ